MALVKPSLGQLGQGLLSLATVAGVQEWSLEASEHVPIFPFAPTRPPRLKDSAGYIPLDG